MGHKWTKFQYYDPICNVRAQGETVGSASQVSEVVTLTSSLGTDVEAIIDSRSIFVLARHVGSRGRAHHPKIWAKELHHLNISYLILFINTRKIAINYFLVYSN